MPSPLQFIHAYDTVYSISGKAYCAQDVGLTLPAGNILCAVTPYSRALGKLDPQALARSKAFSQHYFPQAFAQLLASDLQVGYDRLEVGYDRLAMLAGETTPEEQAGLERHSALYHSLIDGKRDPKTVRTAVSKAVRKWLAEISPTRIKNDESAMRQANIALLEKDVGTGKLLGAVAAQLFTDNPAAMEKCINGTFRQLPEWMQIIAHAEGVFVCTSSIPSRQRTIMGTSYSSIFDETKGMMTLHMNMRKRRTDAQLLHTLREEMTHEMQVAADSEAIMNFDGNTEQHALFSRWHNVATPLLEAIDADPAHPALALICQSDPHGGSLMVEDTPVITRLEELLVDVFDAETLLRSQGHSKDETQRLLEEAFGAEVLRTAQEYTQLWMDKAEKLLAGKTGPEKARQYRMKWEESPFTHRITLDAVPEYRMDGLGIG